jgi:hypothetical protein
MSRQGGRNQDATVELFPFLAVLICTVGALIVLLVVVVQQARHVGTEPVMSPQPDGAKPTGPAQSTDELAENQAQDEPSESDLTEELRDLTWQAEVLSGSRQKTLQRLKAQQLELSRAEDHQRRLKQQLDSLTREAERIDQAAKEASLKKERSGASVSQLEAQVLFAKQQLEEKQRRAKQQSRAYTLIPYTGPHGTKRRAIYIECTADQVILQPEGVILTPKDFEEPIGPDNALAAALRATREYLLDVGLTERSGEAYPLLIVRPPGARAYAACRRALVGWDDEFGYELVADDPTLVYPPADPMLAELLRQTVDEARRRQELRLADPSSPVLFVAPGRGGFVTAEGLPSKPIDRQSPGDELRRQPTAPGGSRPTGHQMTGVREPAPRKPPTGAPATAGEPGRLGNIGPAGLRSPPPTGKAEDNASSDELVRSDSPASAFGTPQGGSGTARDTSWFGGFSSANVNASSLAQTHGPNWALPNAADGAIGITRPVLVTCAPAELIVHPEAGAAERPRRIPFDGPTQTAIQPFVSVLWERIESWGIAGPGVYWKPILKVTVAPGGDARFAEMRSLLDDSGLEIVPR